MGRDVTQVAFSGTDREQYRWKVRRCLDVFATMLGTGMFDAGRSMTGMEIELNLVDQDAMPAMVSAGILSDLVDPVLQTELGQFNLEINVPPKMISGNGLDQYERDILANLRQVNKSAERFGAQVALIGILPTLTMDHTVLANVSGNPRFRILNEEMLSARCGLFDLDIRGVERLRASNDSIAAEAACTSVQFHLQVTPDSFARYWNASQAIAAVQVAIGANSPYFCNRRLWDETRIPLFLQSTDTRAEELKAQGVRPRVWFGERWISSALDLFDENVHYFPPLLPVRDAEEPAEVLRAGGVPTLAELRLHNGTIYRWNRPVYDVAAGRPHLRIENRVLPAGPTVVDMLANAAFYYGLVRALALADQPIWTRMPFAVAEENFTMAARSGIGAQLFWPGLGEAGVVDIVRRVLLPLAYEGLDGFEVAPPVRDRLLGIIEGRCRRRQNGASWQVGTVHSLEHRHGLDRSAALRYMFDRYQEALDHNEPVHQWPLF